MFGTQWGLCGREPLFRLLAGRESRLLAGWLAAATLTLLSQENLLGFQGNPSEQVCGSQVPNSREERHNQKQQSLQVNGVRISTLRIWRLRVSDVAFGRVRTATRARLRSSCRRLACHRAAALWPLVCFTAQQTRSESHTVTSLVKVTAMTSACLSSKCAGPLFLPSLELVYRLV